MAIARAGTGVDVTLRALASQIHPVFMLPPVAVSVLGGTLAGKTSGAFSVTTAGLHATAIFAAVYTAHVKDGYVDFHVRGEDADHPLTGWGCMLALAGATVVFGGAVSLLAIQEKFLAVGLTVPTWLIAYNHAPTLDRTPVGATVGYPLGVALALLGGYASQVDSITGMAIGFAVVFLVLLSGVKVIDDATDVDYDHSIGKRTVAVSVGPLLARRVAYGLMVASLVIVIGLSAVGVAPPTAALSTLPFGFVAWLARSADAEVATMLLVRGAYLMLAVLVAAVWFRPLG